MNHFTDKDGYNGIRATPTWRFTAAQPRGNHPIGAYFTTLTARAPNLAQRLGVPKRKTEYLFTFDGDHGLKPLRGGRGEFIFYSESDYEVVPERQRFCGKSEDS